MLHDPSDQVKIKSNNLFSQPQQYKVNDVTCVQYEKYTEKHKWVYFLFYNKTAQIRERERHSFK